MVDLRTMGYKIETNENGNHLQIKFSPRIEIIKGLSEGWEGSGRSGKTDKDYTSWTEAHDSQ